MKWIAWLARLLLLACLLPLAAYADDFDFHAPASPDDKSAPEAIRDLAERALPVYQDADIERYLANLSILQMVAGDYKAAWDSRQSLRERRHDQDIGKPVGRALLLDLYARARALEIGSSTPFPKAFAQAFHEEVPPLSDYDAYAVTSWLSVPPTTLQMNLQQAFDRQRGKDRINLDDSLELARLWLFYDAYRSFAPLVGGLSNEEASRRYLVAGDVKIHTRAGIDLHVSWMRPKTASKPLPTLLEFSILTGIDEDIRACAAHGYACVIAYTRGKGDAPGSHDENNPILPFEHDGEDARSVMSWIMHQSWSDGRIGMIGDGYSGFTALAASRTHPAALKAIATTNTMVPGVSFPTFGQIFRNSAYRWAIENTQDADDTPMEEKDWTQLDVDWYRSGRPYRDLDRIMDQPSHLFRRWLNHPSYDGYWRKLFPSPTQLAKLDIPVLTMTGYYAEGSVGSLWAFEQLHRYAKKSQVTLLMGPYDDSTIRSLAAPRLKGYPLDPVATLDLRELRFQWLNHVFRGSPLPAQLTDHVNVEVMGSNEWRHAASLEALSNDTLKLHLDPQATAGHHTLSLPPSSLTKSTTLTVRLADRRNAVQPAEPMVLGGPPDTHDRLSFVSEPLKESIELSGALSGQLDLRLNTMDVDFNIALYEQRPDGQYLLLAAPYEIRASYAQDRKHRHLLKAGERQTLSFRSETLSFRRVQAGSRLVFVIGANKRPDREINYGTGNDVSAESIGDRKQPLRLQFFGSSFIELPVRK